MSLAFSGLRTATAISRAGTFFSNHSTTRRPSFPVAAVTTIIALLLRHPTTLPLPRTSTPPRPRRSLAEPDLLPDHCESADGNRTRAAAELGIGLATLKRKLQRHGSTAAGARPRPLIFATHADWSRR